MKNAPLRHALEYGVFLPLRALLRALPHEVARSLGRTLGSIAYRLDRRHRKITLANLLLALPEMDEQARQVTCRACFRHFGMAVADALAAGRYDLRQLCDRLDLEDWHRLEEEQEKGGIFILSAHLGLWEIAAYPLGVYGGPLHAVGRPPDNPWFARDVEALRRRFGNVDIPKRGAVRRMLKVVQEGGRVGILVDQRVQPEDGIRVPFFGVPSWTTPVLARLSRRTGAAVVPVFGYAQPNGRYRVVVREPIRPQEAGELAEEDAVHFLTRRYLEATENEIRRAPEQWLWLHRRWKDSDQQDQSGSGLGDTRPGEENPVREQQEE